MKFFCDEKCNECEIIRNRQLAFLLNFLVEKYGDEIISDVNKFCPNLTCCPDCRIDDFCHVIGCEIVENAEKENGYLKNEV